MLAPPPPEDFSRRGGDSLRFEPALFGVACTLAQRWLFPLRRAHTRSWGAKPHTAATRASRRGAGALLADRVDRVDFLHGGKIGTIGTFEGNPPFAVAAVGIRQNPFFS